MVDKEKYDVEKLMQCGYNGIGSSTAQYLSNAFGKLGVVEAFISDIKQSKKVSKKYKRNVPIYETQKKALGLELAILHNDFEAVACEARMKLTNISLKIQEINSELNDLLEPLNEAIEEIDKGENKNVRA